MTGHLETAARVLIVEVTVHVAAGARAVGRLVVEIVFSDLVGRLAGLEDVRLVLGADYSIETAGLLAEPLVVERDEEQQACLEPLDNCSLEVCAYKHTHWLLGAPGLLAGVRKVQGWCYFYAHC